MHPSLRLSSARAHTPLIRFLGKRTWGPATETPHPHPSAPVEFKQRFSEFLEKQTSSDVTSPAQPSAISNVFNEFWEAPSRFWKPSVRYIGEDEMNAIMSGGASKY